MPKKTELAGWGQASARTGQRPYLSCAQGARMEGQDSGGEKRQKWP